ncbi:hypothetical protein H2198_003976 [Neophaeococcomyces mojaviensis]|uniref:Uncharacterized protein n=1 Tax=Neophaeococcomyces mojaviensis TaxID=3383035 RepID=A0ACC3A9W0_9EURO|nr:hypothetical protein H2198_003976 [Knufia sp. JES_112]
MQNDLAVSLRELRERYGEDFIQILLRIQNHSYSKGRSIRWMEELEVLTLCSRRDATHDTAWFKREHIPHNNYIALSYVWNRSPYEQDLTTYTRRIKSASKGERLSKVRDSALDRVVNYMENYEIKRLWVDRECINQEDRDERQAAIQSMDLLYQTAETSLALLFVPIRTTRELKKLENLLQGEYVTRDTKRKRDDFDIYDGLLLTDCETDTVYNILDLLHRLVSDPWWSRGWCFQEEFVSGPRMNLLIPTNVHPSLIPQGGSFGCMADYAELVVSAVQFRREATRFVFAYLYTGVLKGWKLDKGICSQILAKAGRYNLIMKYGFLLGPYENDKIMSTMIMSDLHRRKLTVPSDILAITANCYRYSTYLDDNKLAELKMSLAMAMLAIYLINGEIFWDYSSEGLMPKQVADLNIFDWLKHISFDFSGATGMNESLSNLKIHRFVEPQLTHDGVESTGILWKIDTFRFTSLFGGRRKRLSEDSDNDACTVLIELVEALKQRHGKLADKLTTFLNRNPRLMINSAEFSTVGTMSASAIRLAKYIEAGHTVGLGNMVEHGCSSNHGVEKSGIFFPEAVERLDDHENSKFPEYAFTAWQGEAKNETWSRGPPAELRNLSLHVQPSGCLPNAAKPFLSTRGWLDGLYFFKTSDMQRYTFSWPKSMLR